MITVEEVTLNERNVLRYIAGFTCHHLHKKKMILSLMSLVKDKEESSCETDEQWVNTLDYGSWTQWACLVEKN